MTLQGLNSYFAACKPSANNPFSGYSVGEKILF